MNIQEARSSDALIVASVLQEAAEWLAGDGRALWSAAEIAHERVLRDVSNGLFHIARQGEHVAGVMKFESEDPYFWPEVLPGTSAFVHKLAVRRSPSVGEDGSLDRTAVLCPDSSPRAWACSPSPGLRRGPARVTKSL